MDPILAHQSNGKAIGGHATVDLALELKLCVVLGEVINFFREHFPPLIRREYAKLIDFHA